MEIRSLRDTSFDELFEAFEEAFADYEVRIDRAEHMAMLRRRGYDPALSFAAFDGGRIVSFTCNGIGDFYGTPTAYDTGTGTLKEYRGQGLATQVFEYSTPYLREAGIREYLLEVLQHNTAAVSVYRKIGFETTREFFYFRAEAGVGAETGIEVEAENSMARAENIGPYAKPSHPHISLRHIDIEEYHSSIPSFWDFKPSWQNNLEAIRRSAEGFVSFGAFTEGKLVGYGVMEPSTGDITQIAVDKRFRRRGVGSLIFSEMLKARGRGPIKIINTDVACDSMTYFLKSKGITPSGKQFEMIKKL